MFLVVAATDIRTFVKSQVVVILVLQIKLLDTLPTPCTEVAPLAFIKDQAFIWRKLLYKETWDSLLNTEKLGSHRSISILISIVFLHYKSLWVRQLPDIFLSSLYTARTRCIQYNCNCGKDSGS